MTITINAEFLIICIAWLITLCILILPIFVMVKLIKAIKRKIQNKNKKQESPRWESEWKYDKKSGLWIHPKSEIPEQGSSYRFTGDQICREEPTAHYYVHHDDTSFRAKQQPFSDPKPREHAEPYKQQWQQPKTAPEPYRSAKVEPVKTANSEFHNAYEATPILTKNEYHNFKTLQEAASRRGLMVWSKVRLADIVKPRNDSKYMSHFGKIKSKHVDFVILDQNMRIKAIIELDDNSHDRADRKARDEFVDLILQDCGYKIIHTRYITPNILDSI